MSESTPIVQGRNIVKRYGHVTAIDHSDFELRHDEILAVIGDNGAGKSSIVKAICGATIPDEGEILIEGKPVHFTSPIQARNMGIEIVYQTLAMSPALSIADNMFMGREIRREGWTGKYLRMLDKKKMEQFARDKLTELGLMTVQSINQTVETLSGGQRQGVAVARAAAFASKVHHHGRTHGGAGRQGIAPGAGADPRRQGARYPDYPDQPQHAARV